MPVSLANSHLVVRRSLADVVHSAFNGCTGLAAVVIHLTLVSNSPCLDSSSFKFTHRLVAKAVVGR